MCFMRCEERRREGTYVLVLYVFQQLEFAIRSFAQDGCTEGFHDLLDRNGGTCQLVLCRTRHA